MIDAKLAPDRLEALTAEADVYLQNLSPDAARRAGLDGDSVFARHPHLAVGEVSGYGKGGSCSSDKAYDLAVQAEAGVFDLCGGGDMRAKVGFSFADIGFDPEVHRLEDPYTAGTWSSSVKRVYSGGQRST